MYMYIYIYIYISINRRKPPGPAHRVRVGGPDRAPLDTPPTDIYIYIYIYIYVYKVALIAQWLGCQPQEAEVLGSILTTSK